MSDTVREIYKLYDDAGPNKIVVVVVVVVVHVVVAAAAAVVAVKW